MNILLTMKTGQRENGEIFINPFFMASEEKIKINFNVAKNIYKDIFRKFITAWFLYGDKNNVPPCNWETFEL